MFPLIKTVYGALPARKGFLLLWLSAETDQETQAMRVIDLLFNFVG